MTVWMIVVNVCAALAVIIGFYQVLLARRAIRRADEARAAYELQLKRLRNGGADA